MDLLSFFKSKPTIFHSKINGEVRVGHSYRQKTLFVQNVPQSGGEFVFMWEKVIKQISNFNPPAGGQISNCLVLGIGGGTVIHAIQNYFPQAKTTGVEIDPVIVQIAQEYFALNPDTTTIVTNDATTWVMKNKGKKLFDLIIVDLYIGDVNPQKTRTREFLVGLKKLLTNGGVILYNCHYQRHNPNEYEEFRKRCISIFAIVEEVFQYPKNRILRFQKKVTKH